MTVRIALVYPLPETEATTVGADAARGSHLSEASKHVGASLFVITISGQGAGNQFFKPRPEQGRHCGRTKLRGLRGRGIPAA